MLFKSRVCVGRWRKLFDKTCQIIKGQANAANSSGIIVENLFFLHTTSRIVFTSLSLASLTRLLT